MGRIKYYYNEDECKFVKSEFTVKSALKSIGSYLTFGGLTAGLILAGLYFFHHNPKEKMLIVQNNELKASITKYDEQIEELQSTLNVLHQKDNEFFRSILNMEPITAGMWNGGTGGAAEVKELTPEAMQETAQKLKQLGTKTAILSASYQSLATSLKDKEKEMARVPSIRPVKGDLISGFGMRMHPILKFNKKHTGLDFAAKTGTPVYAAGDGIIQFAGVHKNGYGIHIDINHGFGYLTKYAHLSELKVRQGQAIKRGDLIGFTGNTGLSKGPHLHYEVIKDGHKIDPVDFFYSDLSPEAFVEFKRKAALANESMD